MEENKRVLKREINYDLLRIVSTVAVIMIHVSAIYKNAITDAGIFGEKYSNHILAIVIYNTLSRFAVPCFMMMSGAFLLADKNNENYKYFYKKSFYNIGITTIIFSILYFVFSESIVLARVILKKGSFIEVIFPVKDILKGAPYYHMWYMYTLLVVYIFIPVIIKIMNEMTEQMFKYLCISSLFVTTISGWTSLFEVNWSVAKAICYIGYIMVGYQIRLHFASKKNNIKAVMCILSGFAVAVLLACVQYDHSIKGIAEIDEKYSLVENFNPLVVVSAVLIFIGFSQIDYYTDKINKVTSKTFLVYLFHAGIITLLTPVMKQLEFLSCDCRIVIPIFVVIVFFISLILSDLYIFVINKIKIKYLSHYKK